MQSEFKNIVSTVSAAVLLYGLGVFALSATQTGWWALYVAVVFLPVVVYGFEHAGKKARSRVLVGQSPFMTAVCFISVYSVIALATTNERKKLIFVVATMIIVYDSASILLNRYPICKLASYGVHLCRLRKSWHAMAGGAVASALAGMLAKMMLGNSQLSLSSATRAFAVLCVVTVLCVATDLFGNRLVKAKTQIGPKQVASAGIRYYSTTETYASYRRATVSEYLASQLSIVYVVFGGLCVILVGLN